MDKALRDLRVAETVDSERAAVEGLRKVKITSSRCSYRVIYVDNAERPVPAREYDRMHEADPNMPFKLLFICQLDGKEERFVRTMLDVEAYRFLVFPD